MREIVQRYEGRTTSRGHEIRVDRYPGEVVLWYLLTGIYDGVYGRHHMGLARIRKQAGVYSVGGLRGAEERPDESRSYWDINKVFGVLDKLIASR